MTHDFRRQGWGWDYIFTPMDPLGSSAHCVGWGVGLRPEDYLLLTHPEGGESRYRIRTLMYFSDPPDMWSARLDFAPRLSGDASP